MPIPQFTSEGLLPPGAWDCTLAEIGEAFCWNDHRTALWEDCLRFIDVEYQAIGAPATLWIDGSFVRQKQLPSDIDVVVDVTDCGDTDSILAMLSLRVRHDALKEMYHVDVWGRHPLIPHDLTQFFQYAGDKCAAELSIDPKHPKGVLRVRP